MANQSTKRRGISAAEKYAELEAAGLERPRCGCHGEPMRWNKKNPQGTQRPSNGGYWICSVFKRARGRAYYKRKSTDLGWANNERARKREYSRNYYHKNSAALSTKKLLYYYENKVRMREQNRAWKRANPGKVRSYNARRIMVGDMYLGTCVFTQEEVEAMLNGASD